MSYQSILTGEISSLIDNLIERKAIIDPNAITQEICSSHADELLDDAPFSTFNNHKNVRREVRNVLSKKLDIVQRPDSPQLVLEGFKHIQRYYCIERDNQIVGVPVGQMTIAELHRKERDIQKMSNTLSDHAEELRMYIDAKLEGNG